MCQVKLPLAINAPARRHRTAQTPHRSVADYRTPPGPPRGPQDPRIDEKHQRRREHRAGGILFSRRPPIHIMHVMPPMTTIARSTTMRPRARRDRPYSVRHHRAGRPYRAVDPGAAAWRNPAIKPQRARHLPSPVLPYNLGSTVSHTIASGASH
jgi:hypothetical protein